MRLIAFSDGASGEFSATLWVFPTSSSCGTAMFVMAASAIQKQQDRQRKPADEVRHPRPPRLLVLVLILILRVHPDLSRQKV